MDRNEIRIISQHSDWSVNDIKKALKDNVYHDAFSWKKFLNLLFISLGVGFTCAGIVFFFAYNWADLNKFIKIGLIEALIIVTTLFSLISRAKPITKDIILTASALLIGVLFAIFGQVYQTGANAYDFFLGWTLFITLLTVVSNFPPLWLIYLALVNTTLILYANQVTHDWSELFVFNLLFIVNSFLLVLATWFKKTKNLNVPNWFLNVVALIVIFIATTGIIHGIFEDYKPSLLSLVIITIICYASGIKFALSEKSGFYLAIIPISLIIIISALFIRISDAEIMFLLTSLFIISSVTGVIKYLIKIQRKWKNE